MTDGPQIESKVHDDWPPWLHDVGEVAAELASDLHMGLSGEEAAARLGRYGPNRLEGPEPVPAWKRFLAHFADPLIYLLLAAVAASALAWLVDGAEGVPYEALVITVIVVLNAVLGYVQEARAEEAVAALQRMASPSAGVLRDGCAQRVPAEEVVPGDVLLLAEGDAIAADGRIFDAASLSVTEASLTGESDAVLKEADTLAQPAALADRLNMVHAGTAVTRGRGRAVVTATGRTTEMGRVAVLLGRIEQQSTPLQREVARIGRMLGLAVIVIAIVVIAAILLTTDITSASDVVDVLLVGVSLAVAAVPEGLPAILSVVLAVGVQRMAREHAIVKRLSSVETLGSASVICSDKTGTLTKNEMTIEKVVTASGEVDVTGSGYRPEGELRVDGRPLRDPVLRDEVRMVLGAGSLVNDAALQEEHGDWTIRGDPTEASFLVAAAKVPGLGEAFDARFERIHELPFTAERKLMTTVQTDLSGELGVAVVTKGAPDVLIARCAAERVAGVIRPISKARRAEVLAEAERLGGLAMRTLALAYRPLDEAAIGNDSELERDLIYLGLVGIIDPPRPEARSAVAEASGAGIRVLMITGDHPVTASRIASDLGITESGGRVLTGAELEALSDDALTARGRDVAVYARVVPEDKLRIVEALKADGQIVAMTGDGVNDAPALKAADIGVAMGETGTDVAKDAADMVLADDNIATVVAAVREGRAIFANIRKFLRFLLSSNIGEVLTMLVGVLAAAPLGLEDAGDAIAVPLVATQILWINLLTDGAPALALGFDPPPDDVMRRRPRGLADRVIDGRLWFGIVWVGLVMALVTLVALDLELRGGLLGGSGTIDEARTMAFTTLVFAQLFNCFNARSDVTSAFTGLFTNRWLWAAIAGSALLQVAVVQLPFMNDAFSTAPLGLGEWAICIALASLVLLATELKKLAGRRVRHSRPPSGDRGA